MAEKNLSRRGFLRLSGLVAAGAVLAGCSPEAQPASTPALENKKPAAANRAAGPTAAQVLPEEAPGLPGVAREKTLIFAFSYGNPLSVNQNLGYMTSQEGNAVVLEPLFFYNPQDDQHPLVPWLAESKWIYNQEYTAMTVGIRKGVEWSDGAPFTAHDVAFTINFNNRQVANQFAPIQWGGQLANNYEEAEAIDDYTVVFKSRGGRPNPRMHRWICSSFDTGLTILPKHIYEKLDPKTVSQMTFIEDNKFIGVVTAPFVCVYNTRSRRIFDRRNDWWAAKTGFAPLPEVERVIVLPSTNDQSVLANQYANNELDTSFPPLPSSHKSIINNNPQLTTWTGRKLPLGNIDAWPNLLWMNCEDELFKDSRGRWAISYALNTEELMNKVWQGMGISTRVPFTKYNLFQKYSNALEPILAKYPVGVQDLAKSAALMTEAGWKKNSDGIWEKDGKIFQPDFGGFDALYSDIGPALCEQMQQAGFKVVYKDDPQLFSGNLTNGTATMFTFGVVCAADVYEVMEYFHSRHWAPNGTSLPLDGWNSRWKNQEYDTIVDEMALMAPEDDEAKYIDRVMRGMEIWYKELPAIPVWQYMHYVPMNTAYWENWPNQDNPYGEPAMWLRSGGFPVAVQLKSRKT